MLDNQTRRELLSKARQSGFPGSILDVFTAYEQGKDLIGEFQQQQQQQQGQQMSDMAAQQAGMMPPGQQPLPQEMPQAPAPPPPGLQGQSLPSPPPPSNPNLVDSTQQQPVGMSTNAKGSSGGQVLMATGGFVEKFTDDQYNKFSSHFPFSKEQRGSIAHRATVEHPDLTMVNPKKYVFGGLKYALGGIEGDPLKKGNIATAADSSFVAAGANAPHNFYLKNGYEVLPPDEVSSFGGGSVAANDFFGQLKYSRDNYEGFPAAKIGESNSGKRVPYKDYTNYKPGNHRFEQRETAIGVINEKAPRSKYDDRISPQKVTTYSNPTTGDLSQVPTYDKLAVTPWKELSDKQKIKRLQQYGGSGTPYSDKASIKKAIQDLKAPKPVEPPMENPKMIEAKPLPLPSIDLKPQLQNTGLQNQTNQTNQPGPKFLRSTIYTPEGPKVRVADMNQRFVRWEDESGETLDFEKTPSGDWQVDFAPTYQDAVRKRSKSLQFATGGKKLLKKRR
jgi:hypothetical protein